MIYYTSPCDWIILAVACLCLAGCDSSEEVLLPPKSKEGLRVQKLLTTLKDQNNDPTKRIYAARELGEMREYIQRNDKTIVPQILKLLPGDCGAVTRECILTLGKIGDKRAIPVLSRMQIEKKVNYHGKILVAIDWALRQLKGKGDKPSRFQSS